MLKVIDNCNGAAVYIPTREVYFSGAALIPVQHKAKFSPLGV